MERMLLHVCCGPCSTVPLARLIDEGAPFGVFFDNPNIQPASEYELRRANFASFAEGLGVEVGEGAYEPDAWDAAVGRHAGVYPLIEGDPALPGNRARREARCRACYAFRFERLARRAAEHGFGAIATTLSISPWQFTDIMASELAAAARRCGLASAFSDYRALFPLSVQKSKEAGMYRQNYCGCRWSQTEAELERAARKAARKAAREAARTVARETAHKQAQHREDKAHA
jgi:predicted adenine nucleotide alpha hydrolase (AANH) superfamily ATPase